MNRIQIEILDEVYFTGDMVPAYDFCSCNITVMRKRKNNL